MTESTHKLIELLSEEDIDYTIINTYVNAVLLVGSIEDALACTDLAIQQPKSLSSLWPIIAKFGSVKEGERLFDQYAQQHHLKEDIAEELFELLGVLSVDKAKQLLVSYAFNDSSDYYQSKHACLGLLHLDCSDISSLIEEEIKQTVGKALFKEFVPALVSKLPNRKEMLQKLYESGSKFCSTDCNAGIILGFSLCGKDGEGYFMEAIFSDRWEAWDRGTGTAYFTYQGFRNLKLSFIDFFRLVKFEQDEKKKQIGLNVLLSALFFYFQDYSRVKTEPVFDIYSLVFGDGSFHKLTADAGVSEIAQRVKALAKMMMLQELLIDEYKK